MALFATSSHNQSWLMTRDDIDQLFQISAVTSSSSASQQDVGTEQGISYLPRKRSPSLAKLDETTDIGRDQFEIILSRYCGYIQHYFGSKKPLVDGIGPKHWRVSATSITYFRRFYLNNSLLNFDPRLIMAASVFLAGKVEDSVVTVSELIVVHKTLTSETLLSTELLLIQALHFHLKVFHPLNVLHTLIADYKRVWEEVMAPRRQLRGLPHISIAKESPCGQFRTIWREKGEEILHTLQRSAVTLSHTPTEIAVCALRMSELSARNVLAGKEDEVYPEYSIDDHLLARFGEAEAAALIQQASEVTDYLNHVKSSDEDDAAFKHAMDAVRKQSVWNTKKEKKEKVQKIT